MTDKLTRYLHNRNIGACIFTYDYIDTGVVCTVDIQQIRITGDLALSFREAEENVSCKALNILKSTPGIRFKNVD